MKQGSGVLEKNSPSLDGEQGRNSEESREYAIQECIPGWKRVFDIIGASLCLVVVSPVLLVSAILIKCVSRGPVFFKNQWNKACFQKGTTGQMAPVATGHDRHTCC